MANRINKYIRYNPRPRYHSTDTTSFTFETGERVKVVGNPFDCSITLDGVVLWSGGQNWVRATRVAQAVATALANGECPRAACVAAAKDYLEGELV